MKKRILTGILLLGALAMVLAGCASTPTFQGTGSKSTEVTLRLVTMEGEKLYDGKVKVVDDNPMAYMALKAAAQEKKLTLDITDESDPARMFLNGINDLKSANPAFWMIYINKYAATAGMGAQPISANDVVEFIYGDYNKGYSDIK